MQRVAALLSDGGIAVFAAPEEDYWKEGMEEADGSDAPAELDPVQLIEDATGGHDHQSACCGTVLLHGQAPDA